MQNILISMDFWLNFVIHSHILWFFFVLSCCCLYDIPVSIDSSRQSKLLIHVYLWYIKYKYKFVGCGEWKTFLFRFLVKLFFLFCCCRFFFCILLFCIIIIIISVQWTPFPYFIYCFMNCFVLIENCLHITDPILFFFLLLKTYFPHSCCVFSIIFYVINIMQIPIIWTFFLC